MLSSVQLLSRVRLLATLWIVACQASLSITNSQSSLKLTSIELVMPFSHLILCCPLFLLPPIPPSFGSIPSFFLELFLHQSPVAYWAPTNLGSSSFSVICFCFFIVFMGQKNTSPKVLLQRTTFCQNSPPCLGWPYMACLILSLS